MYIVAKWRVGADANPVCARCLNNRYICHVYNTSVEARFGCATRAGCVR